MNNLTKILKRKMKSPLIIKIINKSKEEIRLQIVDTLRELEID